MHFLVKMKKASLIILLFELFAPGLASALIFPLPTSNIQIVGQVQTVTVQPGQNITDIGQKYDIGYYEFLEANPGVDIDNLQPGTTLVVPSRFILPNVPHVGIVVNLAEMRVYYFPKGKAEVVTFPIGIGRMGWNTPVTKTFIANKQKNPIWTPPASIRQEDLKLGIVLPKYIPSGETNPLGYYAMRLGIGDYLMHGTNDPSGIGHRSSSGCLRMFPDDIEQLFNMVSVGTPVNIVDEPFKAGWEGNTLYLESHVPIDVKRGVLPKSLTPMVQLINSQTKGNHVVVNWTAVLTTAKQQLGIPQPIGYIGNSAGSVKQVTDQASLTAVTSTINDEEQSDSHDIYSSDTDDQQPSL